MKCRIGAVLGASVALLCLVVPAYSQIAEIRCGKINKFNLLPDDGVEIVWKEEDYGPMPTLEEGEKFAVITVSLKKECSIGKYDYSLSGAKCLGISVNIDAFSPARWEETYKDDLTEVHLLFKVKEADAPFTLKSNFNGDREAPVERLGMSVAVQDDIENPDGKAGAEDEAGAEGDDAEVALLKEAEKLDDKDNAKNE
jgi:hypothetical protein